jgi:hypothetical protein
MFDKNDERFITIESGIGMVTKVLESTKEKIASLTTETTNKLSNNDSPLVSNKLVLGTWD